MKKLNVILLLFGAAFLFCLVRNIGAHELWRELGQLGWGLVPFVLGEGIAEMLHTVGWRYCLSGPCQSVSWPRLFQFRMAGYAINYLTPTAALGGEATKAALLAADRPGPQAVSGVLIDKVCFCLGQILFVGFGALFIVRHVNLSGPLWLSMLLSGVLMTVGIVGFLFLQKSGRLGGLVRRLAARKPGHAGLQKMAGSVTGVDEALRQFYRERPRAMWFAVAWHLAGFGVGIVQTWLFFHLLKQDASWFVASAIWVLGMWFDLLTFAVPMNMGSLEGSRVVALKAVGFTSVVGMTYGVALRLAQTFWAVVGLIIYGGLTVQEILPPESASGANAGQPAVLNNVEPMEQ